MCFRFEWLDPLRLLVGALAGLIDPYFPTGFSNDLLLLPKDLLSGILVVTAGLRGK